MELSGAWSVLGKRLRMGCHNGKSPSPLAQLAGGPPRDKAMAPSLSPGSSNYSPDRLSLPP